MEKKVECKVVAAKDATPASCTQVEKTNTKLKHNHGDCTTTMTFANDKMAMEAKAKLVNDDDWKIDLTCAGEIKQASKAYKFTGKLDILSGDMGGAKAAINVSILLECMTFFLNQFERWWALHLIQINTRSKRVISTWY